MSSPRERDTFEEISSSSPLLLRSPTSPDVLSLKSTKSWIHVVVVGAFAIFLVELGNLLVNPARTRLYESSVCVRFYQDTDPSKILNGTVEEQLCKINDVQDVVAMLFGWQDLFDAIPSMLLAVPYGALADKYGRKWIFVLGFLGLELSLLWVGLICWLDLSLKLTWFSSVFLVFGGGSMVIVALVFTILSDVVPQERRTTTFFYVGGTLLLSEILAPLLSFSLMKHGDWLPFCVGTIIAGLATVITCFLPETLHHRKEAEESHNDNDMSDRASMCSGKGQGHGFKNQIHRLKETFAFLKKDLHLTLAISCFLVNRIARSSQELVIRYASQRYGWTIRQATLLASLRASFNMLTLIAVLPGLSYLFLNWLKLTPQRGDLWIARGSKICTVTAFVIMAFSFTPALLILGMIFYTFGSGFSMALRSVVVYMVGGQESKDIGRLFAIVAIMESAGQLIAGPLLSQLFRWGMKLGKAWLGMPFLFSAVLFLPILVIVFYIQLKDLSTLPDSFGADDEETLQEQPHNHMEPYTDEDHIK